MIDQARTLPGRLTNGTQQQIDTHGTFLDGVAAQRPQ
jgi:hypothetical protein